METILAAVITGGVTLIGVLIANGKTQAVTAATACGSTPQRAPCPASPAPWI